MAINLDINLLIELGLGSLPEAEQKSLLNHIYETLEMRVGMRLADQMSNEQLDEFERYFEAKDEAGAFHWLETNFPNYKEIVQDEFNKLKEEIRQSAPQILQAAQSNNDQAGYQTTGPQQTQPGNPQMPPQAPNWQQPPTSANNGNDQYQAPPSQQPMPPYQQPPEDQSNQGPFRSA